MAISSVLKGLAIIGNRIRRDMVSDPNSGGPRVCASTVGRCCEFSKRDSDCKPLEQLTEVAEAATTVGYPGGQQGGYKKGPGRPIFALAFYEKLVAVAISVGSKGFVVGMNRSSLDQFF
ncbi:hypothetical protein ACJ72_02861 [Emergomyces africanus]|uniref:Uncharacterized protein n=1 Tax=Emergomyces africanus TaxID=1955775 RepID=A0A1B7P190_9EURO|nr:hypothetical protein ACJ72_02861 [Emergomyces africanus]